MKRYIILTIVFSIVNIYGQLGSSGVSDAKNMGLAKTHNAISRGIHAIGINPANLIYGESNSTEFSAVLPIPQISVRTGTDFMTLEEVNYFFGGVNGKARVLTEDDKTRLNNLFEDGGKFFLDNSFELFSFNYTSKPKIGSFAFSIKDYVGGYFQVPQAVVSIALTGNPVGKVYHFNDTDAKFWWLRSYSLTYARELSEIKQKIFDKIGAGISLKLMHGYAYATTEKVNTNLTFDQKNAMSGYADLLAYSSFSPDLGVKYDFEDSKSDPNASPFPSPAGTGFGLDIGFTAQLDKRWNFALSITDIGSINWSEKTAKFYANNDFYIDDLSSEEQRDTLESKFKGTSEKTGSFSTGLPTALRMGVSYLFTEKNSDVPGVLILAFDYNQGFNDLPGNSTKPRISIGADWKPMNWIPYIRTGFSFGGLMGFGWGAGLGFDMKVVEINISTSDMQTYLAPNSSKHLTISFGSKWKF